MGERAKISHLLVGKVHVKFFSGGTQVGRGIAGLREGDNGKEAG